MKEVACILCEPQEIAGMQVYDEEMHFRHEKLSRTGDARDKVQIIAPP